MVLPAKSITAMETSSSCGRFSMRSTSAVARTPSGSLTRMDWLASMATMILMGRMTSFAPSVQKRPSSATARSAGTSVSRRGS